MDTDRLVDSLVDDLEPVRALRPAWLRAAGWLSIGSLAVGGIVLLAGPRADLSEKLLDGSFLSQEVAMIATAAVGSWAALCAVIPGSARAIPWIPVLPLLGWLISMGQQYLSELAEFGSAGLTVGMDPQCIPGIAMAGSVPLLAMIVMLRKGAGCNGAIAVFWGTLASAALANAGLRLFHMVDGALMVIVWQFGTVLAFTALSTFASGRLVPSRIPTALTT